jgi:precorrin-2/cobalt-factor-2 C20-methyltransferase
VSGSGSASSSSARGSGNSGGHTGSSGIGKGSSNGGSGRGNDGGASTVGGGSGRGNDGGGPKASTAPLDVPTNRDKGLLIGVGVGPGDPELITLKAVRALENADVVAHFAKAGNPSNARATAARYLKSGTREVQLLYPVTTEYPTSEAAYRTAIDRFFDDSAAQLAQDLEAGRTVAVLSEGDPLFFGSYMHIHIRLMNRFRTEVIPGVTAMSGCWSAAGLPIVQGDDVLTVLPGTLGQETLVQRLQKNEPTVIMKLGRNLPKVRRALIESGRLEQAIYVERGTMHNERLMPLPEKTDDSAPYFAIVLVTNRWWQR